MFEINQKCIAFAHFYSIIFPILILLDVFCLFVLKISNKILLLQALHFFYNPSGPDLSKNGKKVGQVWAFSYRAVQKNSWFCILWFHIKMFKLIIQIIFGLCSIFIKFERRPKPTSRDMATQSSEDFSNLDKILNDQIKL